jgi:hypothetical protein
MNLLVGEDDMTADKDYRHVDKRIRNLLLRKRGIAIRDQLITPAILRQHLRDAGHSKEHLDSIFRPNDLQDTMLTYQLINDIASLPSLESDDTHSIGYKSSRCAIRILGKLFWYILYPYICIDLSLHEQLEYLSAAAFLAFVLYRKSKQHFLPTLLYCDIMIMIKNVYFCFAKAKVDTPLGKFFLILLGTDRLEALFGIIRTMIGNDANADILQLATRITGTTEVANILAEHPHWDKTPRRLKYPTISREGKVVELPDKSDHVNPACWLGNVDVNSTNPLTPWKGGRRRIEDDREIMAVLKDDIAQLDIEAQNSSALDVLSPFGKLLINQPLEKNDNEDNDDLWCLPTSDESSSEFHNRIPGAGFSQEVEDMVTEDPDCEVPTTSSFERFVITSGGTRINKARALALRLKDKQSASSTDRLRRVQGHSRFNAVSSSGSLLDDDNSVFGGSSLIIGDPIASIARCEGMLFLCIGEVASISHSADVVDSITTNLLREEVIQVTFQLISLVSASADDDTSLKHDWRSRRGLTIIPVQATVPGRLIQPINPRIEIPKDDSSKSFYLFDSNVLVKLAAQFMDGISIADAKYIPSISRSPAFPYLSAGDACFALESDSHNAATLPIHDVCPACPNPTPINLNSPHDVLAHMGAHILHDPATKAVSMPCGLCLSPAPMCHFILYKGNGAQSGLQIDLKRSRCLHLTKKFSYKTASISSKNSRSSNVPIPCPLCDVKASAVWRYCLREHFLLMHPSADLLKYQDLWELSVDEKSRMRWEWNHRAEVKKKKSKKNAPPLQVSDKHSSRMALRYGNTI